MYHRRGELGGRGFAAGAAGYMGQVFIATLRRHWPEYLIEAASLGLFMLAACLGGAALEHPSSPVHAALPDPTLRRAVMGLLMGLTAIGLIYSPWGARSGAHMNPSVTIAFLRLGKITWVDAVWYVLAQFAGGVGGVFVSALLLGSVLADPSVNYVVTVPGPTGVWIAFSAEFAISFLLMMTVLVVSGHPRWSRYTGLCAGLLVGIYILIEAPVSGMSMNPARTLGSALMGHTYTAWWIYFTAPPCAMLFAAELYHRVKDSYDDMCAKLHHAPMHHCIHCGQLPETVSNAEPLTS
jgi:aquaporin Z